MDPRARPSAFLRIQLAARLDHPTSCRSTTPGGGRGPLGLCLSGGSLGPTAASPAARQDAVRIARDRPRPGYAHGRDVVTSSPRTSSWRRVTPGSRTSASPGQRPRPRARATAWAPPSVLQYMAPEHAGGGVGGFSGRPLLGRACSTDARRRPYTGPSAHVMSCGHARPAALVQAARPECRGARALIARNLSAEPSDRSPHGRHRCGPGGEPDRAGDAGCLSPRAVDGRRAGARPRRLPAPRARAGYARLFAADGRRRSSPGPTGNGSRSPPPCWAETPSADSLRARGSRSPVLPNRRRPGRPLPRNWSSTRWGGAMSHQASGWIGRVRRLLGRAGRLWSRVRAAPGHRAVGRGEFEDCAGGRAGRRHQRPRPNDQT